MTASVHIEFYFVWEGLLNPFVKSFWLGAKSSPRAKTFLRYLFSNTNAELLLGTRINRVQQIHCAEGVPEGDFHACTLVIGADFDQTETALTPLFGFLEYCGFLVRGVTVETHTGVHRVSVVLQLLFQVFHVQRFADT